LLGKAKPRNITYVEKARILADLFFLELDNKLFPTPLKASIKLDLDVSFNNIKAKLTLKSNISVPEPSRFIYKFLKVYGKPLFIAFIAFILAIIKTRYYL
jgi:hypothetical protein